jgi:hypothetical protein
VPGAFRITTPEVAEATRRSQLTGDLLGSEPALILAIPQSIHGTGGAGDESVHGLDAARRLLRRHETTSVCVPVQHQAAYIPQRSKRAPTLSSLTFLTDTSRRSHIPKWGVLRGEGTNEGQGKVASGYSEGKDT